MLPIFVTIVVTSNLILGAHPSCADTFGPGWPPSKIRIALTRSIQQPNSDKLRAPDISYYGAAGFGQPEKVFNVVFDTGSSDIWVPYYNWFPFANNLHYSDGYKCGDSTRCKPNNDKYTINYRDTQLDAEGYTDVMTIHEGVTKDDIPVVVAPRFAFEQNFLATTSASDDQFRYKPYDGVVGLPPIGVSSSGVINLMENFMKEQRAETGTTQAPFDPSDPDDYLRRNRKMFSFWFNPDEASQPGGELTIGGVDERRFTGEVVFHKINGYYTWQLPLEYVALGGLVFSCDNGCNVTMDTGSNSLVGPRKDIEDIAKEFQAKYDNDSGLWLVNCGKRELFAPALCFNIDGTPYNLYPKDYIKVFKFQEATTCYLDIKAADSENWRLGTTFMSAYYTVFDYLDNHVGFSKLKNLN